MQDMNTIESCSTTGGLNDINIDTYCNQQTSIQTQPLNESNKIPNSQDNIDSNQGKTVNPASNSIIDRILGLLFGFINL